MNRRYSVRLLERIILQTIRDYFPFVAIQPGYQRKNKYHKENLGRNKISAYGKLNFLVGECFIAKCGIHAPFGWLADDSRVREGRRPFDKNWPLSSGQGDSAVNWVASWNGRGARSP
ncbi:hypothetical protein TNIN_372941 [Trichonephila inaurata madagascariensis]|uniref:Uncharacterized protein n=1 Tax=Trichonephila inaurata madagascariensis TaxID=2747483 RepID=A0A8X7CF12_9ARAC|nr:hypothetical protein TNIN_372941 [Trichonephila inaurata madagascariensis]